jgi:hypothetical protein
MPQSGLRTDMPHEEFNHVETPEGTTLEPCPLCGSPAEIWRHSEDLDSPTRTAVMCGNSDPISPGLDGCVLYMVPQTFYHGRMADAVKYWNEYAFAIQMRRNAP